MSLREDTLKRATRQRTLSGILPPCCSQGAEKLLCWATSISQNGLNSPCVSICVSHSITKGSGKGCDGAENLDAKPGWWGTGQEITIQAIDKTKVTEPPWRF